ncbi:hypothetical protein TNCT6_76670 [Streptomyces sp. 6-11-2]|nr:hypothetical protein TNCT6_76670 [Streptomyces sp. 6-11-2]
MRRGGKVTPAGDGTANNAFTDRHALLTTRWVRTSGRVQGKPEPARAQWVSSATPQRWRLRRATAVPSRAGTVVQAIVWRKAGQVGAEVRAPATA